MNGPSRLNILLVGGGGREHALAWKLAQSPSLGTLWTASPGNPGVDDLARPMEFELSLRELYRVEQFCRRESIDLVVVGPEAPLAAGIADRLAKERTYVFGPTAAGARLEADKAWAKHIMKAASVPTAEARVFDEPENAKSWIESRQEPVVVKASGLAAGKGVVVASDPAEAIAAIDDFMVKRIHGDAGKRVVIEERLSGPEVSVFALVDGRNAVVLETCQDHKRIGEGDSGPNTGGMGAYSPTPFIDAPMMRQIQSEVLIPTVDAMRREGIEYRGVLYAGLMLTPGGPKVLEFNVRFGDPECQVLMPRLECDMARVLYETAAGQLDESPDIGFTSDHTVCVVLASGGYPGKYPKGLAITGLDDAAATPDVQIFHAGTIRAPDGVIRTAGGRVLNVVASGPTLRDARDRALDAASKIHFDGMQYRRDIGWRALEQQSAS